MLLAFPLSSYLCTTHGWRSSFWVPALPTVPCVFLLLVFGSSSPRKNRWVGEVERAMLAAETQREDTAKVAIRWGRLLSEPMLWNITFSMFCANWAAYMYLAELPLYLVSLGFSEEQLGWVSNIVMLMNPVMSVVFAVAADALVASRRLSVQGTRHAMNSVGLCGPGVCLALVAVADTPTLIVGLMAIGYALLPAVASGCFVSTLDVAPRTVGVVYGFANCVGMFQGVVSPFLTAALLAEGGAANGSSGDASESGGWAHVWGVAAGLLFVGAAVFLRSTTEVLEQRWIRDA